MAALKKRYYPKIAEEVYLATLDNGMSLSIIKKKDSLKSCLSVYKFWGTR